MRRLLITGGCGFVGCNLADQCIRDGDSVVLFDNLSRKGTEHNLTWLQSKHAGRFAFVKGDVRDYPALRNVVAAGFDAVYHTAGQVAVTTSVTQPREDFEVNALGTFNLLEAVRETQIDPALIFTSTNKVYGGIEQALIVNQGGRYAYRDYPQGIDESCPLDFHSPYGCSKGTADQYVRDYSRIFGLRTVVFRMSCQYGTRQFGNEDQGWVVHFVIAAHFGRTINVYGDGRQVRDILFIDDLVRAFRAATDRIEDTKGRIFNIGGGPANVMSLLELVELLQKITGRTLELQFGDWRPGDQKVYVSNIARAAEAFGWTPTVSKTEGVQKLYDWVSRNESLFRS